MKKSIVTLFLAFFVAQPALANYICEGPVQNLGMNPATGNVTLNIGTGYHYMCSVNENYNRGTASYDAVTPEACRAMYAAFQAAKSLGANIKFWYTSSGSTPDCTVGAQASWDVPAPYPYYMEIVY